jgi:hypothetical protein
MICWAPKREIEL